MLESPVTESRGLDTSSEVESDQDVTHDASSTPPDTSRAPTSSDANKTSRVDVPNGPVIPLEPSSEASAVGVDAPLESDAAVDEDLDLTPRLPSVATRVGQESQHDRRLSQLPTWTSMLKPREQVLPDGLLRLHVLNFWMISSAVQDHVQGIYNGFTTAISHFCLSMP